MESPVEEDFEQFGGRAHNFIQSLTDEHENDFVKKKECTKIGEETEFLTDFNFKQLRVSGDKCRIYDVMYLERGLKRHYAVCVILTALFNLSRIPLAFLLALDVPCFASSEIVLWPFSSSLISFNFDLSYRQMV